MNLNHAIIKAGLVIAVVGCSGQKFTTSAQQAPQTEKPSPTPVVQDAVSLNLQVPCSTQSAPENLASESDKVTISIKNDCSELLKTQSSQNKKVPADIVFVLDISGSMQPFIEVIKTNIVQFSKNLTSKGFDSRFAAVGYRDTVDNKIPFTTAESLSTQLVSWKAGGGVDKQEAGQLGIHAALDLFSSDLAAMPDRASADKVMLFVTDAISFNGTNHSDFSINDLASRMANLKNSTLQRLKFYHSACDKPIPVSSVASPAPGTTGLVALPAYECDTVPGSGGSATSALMPAVQMKNLLDASKVPGTGFDFPLTGDVFLNQFGSEFASIEIEEKHVCFLTDAKLVKGTVEVESFKTKDLTEARAKYNIEKQISFAKSLENGSYVFAGSRCCVAESAAATSTCSKKSSFAYNISIAAKKEVDSAQP